jgi:hypothetical protein
MLTLVTIICLCLFLSSCRKKADTVLIVKENGVSATGQVTFTRGSDGKYGPNAWQPGAIVIFRVDRTIEGESGQAGTVYLINKDRKLEKIGKADLNKSDGDLAAEYLKSDSREGQPSQSASASPPQSKAIGGQKSDQQGQGESSSTTSPLGLIAASDEADQSHWQQLSPKLSLLGKVAKGVDTSNSTSESPRFQYNVEIRIKNTATSAIAYDRVERAFIPAVGEPLRIVQTVQTFQDLQDLQNLRTQGIKVTNIKSGDEEKFEVDTNGYTNDLLNRTEGKPLIFDVRFRYKGRVVAGPFRADLPDLRQLPAPVSGAPPSAFYLEFKPR